MAERPVHRINGAAANLGGEALLGKALEIEKAGKTGDREVPCILLPEVLKRFARLQEAMEKYTGEAF